MFAKDFVPDRPAFGLTPQLRALVSSLQERRSRTAADRELARRVHAAVEGATRGGLAASGLSFYVHDGTVAIYGSVRDDVTRETVLALAAEQPGARRIIDHLGLHEA